MNDTLELTSFPGMTEYKRAERWAVDRTIRIEDSCTKGMDNVSPRRFAWLDHISRQLVGIDHDGAALPEHFRDRAFPGGDASGESNQHHGSGAYHVLYLSGNRD
jgi:hypothetical protein